ncbi:PREDICTED: uncharacterized protein LOC109587102 isoform X2 [Amphimedon queenslandica]|uniref:COR domain-containing protein n=1 Tax=Amphimedon queenslandica TaxID=400682 RepID=A0AAN0JPY5_AMPQE|nr:PREDICTED: uncharacterized protein LOC109587102 isoform X2 [Amphimedon queenslandica]|eukprot:XP_019858882.1 PREDICTED: uncharacterized protein LOC109587102 isoform X2 [Amphimedon queenslandica]
MSDDYNSPDCYRQDAHTSRDYYRRDARTSQGRYRSADYISQDRYGQDDYNSQARHYADTHTSPNYYMGNARTSRDHYRSSGYNSQDHYNEHAHASPVHYRPHAHTDRYRPHAHASQDHYRSEDHYRPDGYNSQDRYERPGRPDNPEDVSSNTRRFIGRQVFESNHNLQHQNPRDHHHEKEHQVGSDRSVQYRTHMLSDKKWKEVDENDEIEEVARLIAAVYEKASGSENLRTAVAASSLYKVDSSLSPPELSGQEIQRKEVDLFLAKAIKRAQEIGPVPIQDIKPQPFMHIWDCGGQAVFLEILSAFLTPRTLFFLIFNAAKGLDEKWENILNTKGNLVCDNLENMSTKDLLFNWMTNIHLHLDRDERGAFLSYPRIYCIGTHGDQIVDDKQRAAAIERMKGTYKGKACAYLIKKVLIVDNTTAGSRNEDQNFSTIRKEVNDFTSNKLIVKTLVSWVLFRKVIKMLDKKVISLKEAHEIGLACKIPLNDVPKVLRFYHDLGVLLYYSFIKGLQDTVIINPQWFVDTLGKVFTLEGRENQDATEAMWSLLREKGILVEPLYQEVWKNCTEIKADDLMELLVHFRLAAEVKTDEFYIEDAKQYFLPAVLKSYDISSTQSLPNGKPVARATNLHITFSTDFVPPGFFTRFIASFAKNSSCKICFEEGVFRNRIVFLFGTPSVNQVTFTDLCTTIRVSVERFIDVPNVPFRSTCQELNRLLEKCGNEVNETLANSSKIKRSLNYECRSTACNGYEPHYISPASGQTAVLNLFCQKRKTQRQPTSEESYWFPELEEDQSHETTQNVPETIDEKEIVKISKRVGDKAAILAACMEMLPTFKALQQSPAHCKDPMFHLLFEWKDKNKSRDDLVEALKLADLDQLADQVKVFNYRDTSKRLSIGSTRQNVEDTEPKKDTETKKSDIERDDLLLLSNFFEAKDIRKIVEICDDDSGYLQSAMDKYKHSDTQTIAFQVLYALVRRNPSITKESLKKKLYLMKFQEAANKLSVPSEATQPAQTTQPTKNSRCFLL